VDVPNSLASKVRLPVRCVLFGALVATVLGVLVPTGSASALDQIEAAAAAATRSAFHPIAPLRLLDTRSAGVRLQAGTSVTLSVVPTNGRTSIAAVVNLTAVHAAEAGFLTAYPANRSRPEASNINLSWAGQTVAGLATVPLDSNGRFTVYSSTTTDLLVDVFGVYDATVSARAGRLVSTEPTRVLDTRNSVSFHPMEQRVVSLLSAIPSDASAVVLNATVTQAADAGYLTIWAAGQERPDTSNLNVAGAGDTVANQVIVPVHNGAVEIYSQGGAEVILDVDGYFTGENAPVATEGLFVPVTPFRLLDTRADGDLNPIEDRLKPRKDWTVEVAVSHRGGIPWGAAAVALTTTVVHAEGAGFASVWPAGLPQPASSSLNSSARGQTVANHVISRVSQRGLSIFTSTPMHLLADVSGWYTGTSARATLPPARTVLPAVSGRIDIPALTLSDALGDGTEDVILDQGPMHWSMSSMPGELGTMFILGHRSSHGGPFLRLAELVPGDVVRVTNAGQTFTYRVTGRRVVQPEDVLGLAEPATANLMLVACHPIGSTAQRVVVRAELV
jgi:LPXTG-site transpeptidase (sortase) family protein